MDTLIKRLEQGHLTRIVALGSSTTEKAGHSTGAYNWFDWIDVGLRETYGRVHHCINCGVRGDTTRHLISRFERDVAFYRPQIVILTIGGNDSDPARSISAKEFRDNFIHILNLVYNIQGSLPIVQTYFSPDHEYLDSVWSSRFIAFMDIIREIALTRNTYIIDNLKRWDSLRLSYRDEYRALMIDAMHVSAMGNLVWGMDVCRHFRATIPTHIDPVNITTSLGYQKKMDLLSSTHY